MDKIIKDEDIQKFVPLVSKYIKKFLTNPLLDYDDLFQEGCIAITHGIKTHDPELGASLFSHVYWQVKRYVNHYVRKEMNQKNRKPEWKNYLTMLRSDPISMEDSIIGTTVYNRILGQFDTKDQEIIETHQAIKESNLSIKELSTKYNMSVKQIYQKRYTCVKQAKKMYAVIGVT